MNSAGDKTMTNELVTEAMIDALRGEAGAAGDLAMVAICDRALGGDQAAIDSCVAVIRTAADVDD
jgi:hypothetical protein